MTSFIEEEKVTAALEAGASGYLLKDAEAEEVAARCAPRTRARCISIPPWRGCWPSGCAPRRRAGARRAADRPREGRPAAARPGDEQQGDRRRRCSSARARPGPTSRTSSASSGSPAGPRPRCTPSSTSWSTRRSRVARAAPPGRRTFAIFVRGRVGVRAILSVSRGGHARIFDMRSSQDIGPPSPPLPLPPLSPPPLPPLRRGVARRADRVPIRRAFAILVRGRVRVRADLSVSGVGHARIFEMCVSQEHSVRPRTEPARTELGDPRIR